MKALLFLLLYILCASCKQKIIDDKLSKRLFIYFKENLKTFDTTHVLDSLRAVNLDTITKKDVIFSKIESINYKFEDNLQKEKILGIEIKSDIQLAKLYNGLSTTLKDNYVDEGKDKLLELREIHSTDSLLLITQDSLSRIYKIADSSNLLYYQVKCLRQFHRKDMSVRRDTVFAFLTPDKNIIKKEEMTW